MEFLYILKSATADQIKIGITRNKETLFSRINALGGFTLFDESESFIYECENAKVVEKFLHYHFRKHNIEKQKAFTEEGRTECFEASIRNKVIDFIESNNLAVGLK